MGLLEWVLRTAFSKLVVFFDLHSSRLSHLQLCYTGKERKESEMYSIIPDL